MSIIHNDEPMRSTIREIPRSRVLAPKHIPVKVYVREAQFLASWCEDDRDILVNHGLPVEMLDQLAQRTRMLREAEADWTLNRYQKNEAETQWALEFPRARDLVKTLLHAFRFAYQKNSSIKQSLKYCDIRHSAPTIIQRLNNLLVIGRLNPVPLHEINFDMALLDQAEQLVDTLKNLLAIRCCAMREGNKIKLFRDQAYTHLKEAVDAIRRVGKYVFWRDKERKDGYASEFLRKRYQNSKQRKQEIAAVASFSKQDPVVQGGAKIAGRYTHMIYPGGFFAAGYSIPNPPPPFMDASQAAVLRLSDGRKQTRI